MAAAAGIAAAGSVLGGVLGGKGAKKAAKIQQQTAQMQIAAANQNRDYQYSLNAPTITTGNNANDTMAGLLNVGGDAAASTKALGDFRASSGYNDLLTQGLKSVNAAGYSAGMGRSGATLKALQDRGTQIANSSEQQYLGNLGTLANLGTAARGLVAGVGTNTVNATNQSSQNAADASSNAALYSGSNWAKVLQNLAGAGASALGSSYGSGGSSGTGAIYGGNLGGIY